MGEKTVQAIEAILKRGNDVEVRRKGDGYIILGSWLFSFIKICPTGR